ncbi:cell wall hydrolase [Altererythrobacter sp. SALINAS58]|uniref:cell wall hydrolase n=1 Tax=Alteripontixanthobacter muriae TaxID=2705546 RepID=UPI001E4E5D7F|nr:cell wall hydrolase [Alteripontixanthobacter muriae]NTZ43943.1 cell wall hydrolase [Alteripontixanthobacter muriae]
MQIERVVERKVWLWGAVALIAILFAGFAIAYGFDVFGQASPAKESADAELSPVAQLAIPPGMEQVEVLSKEEILAANLALPYSADPVEAALPFKQPADWLETTSFQSALECLTSAIYYEANNEGEAGQRAVAQVVLNRVRHPAFPSSVCGVIYEGSHLRTGCQFTFTCDGSLSRTASSRGWERAKRVASEALRGKVEQSVGTATHYHANYVLPYWAPSLAKVASINTHIFYRWSGSWGRRGAFRQLYSGETSSIPIIEAAPVFQDLEEATIDTPISPPVENSSQILLDRPSLTTGFKTPPKIRADQAAGTLKVDDAESELKIRPQAD